MDFEVGYYKGTARMSFPADKFEERLHRVLGDGKHLWCCGSAGVDSESEEAAASKRKKKKNGATNSVEVKADRIDGTANELKENMAKGIQECSTIYVWACICRS